VPVKLTAFGVEVLLSKEPFDKEQRSIGDEGLVERCRQLGGELGSLVRSITSRGCCELIVRILILVLEDSDIGTNIGELKANFLGCAFLFLLAGSCTLEFLLAGSCTLEFFLDGSCTFVFLLAGSCAVVIGEKYLEIGELVKSIVLLNFRLDFCFFDENFNCLSRDTEFNSCIRGLITPP
jgi:hypothetical protein